MDKDSENDAREVEEEQSGGQCGNVRLLVGAAKRGTTDDVEPIDGQCKRQVERRDDVRLKQFVKIAWFTVVNEGKEQIKEVEQVRETREEDVKAAQ